MAAVHLALLLRPEGRTPGGRQALTLACRHLGLEVSGAGDVTVSARASPEVFETLFGAAPRRVAPRPPSTSDFGAPGGHAAEGALDVPEALLPYVESVTIVPPSTFLT